MWYNAGNAEDSGSVSISTGTPSGGAAGDVHLQV